MLQNHRSGPQNAGQASQWSDTRYNSQQPQGNQEPQQLTQGSIKKTNHQSKSSDQTKPQGADAKKGVLTLTKG